MLCVFWALLSSIAYGCSDFYAGLASRRVGALPVTFVSCCMGLIVIGVLALSRPAVASRGDLLDGTLCGLCSTIGFLLFYAALRHGAMGIIAAMTAVTTDCVPLFVGISRGERLHATQEIGVAFALLAVVLIAFDGGIPGSGRKISLGILQGAAGGGCFGAALTFIGSARAEAGLWPSFAAAGASVVLSLGIVLSMRVPVRMEKKVLGMCAMSGTLCIAGLVFFLLSRFSGELSLAAVVCSLSPIVLAVLSHTLLGERLRVHQLCGILSAVLAVTLIAL